MTFSMTEVDSITVLSLLIRFLAIYWKHFRPRQPRPKPKQLAGETQQISLAGCGWS